MEQSGAFKNLYAANEGGENLDEWSKIAEVRVVEGFREIFREILIKLSLVLRTIFIYNVVIGMISFFIEIRTGWYKIFVIKLYKCTKLPCKHNLKGKEKNTPSLKENCSTHKSVSCVCLSLYDENSRFRYFLITQKELFELSFTLFPREGLERIRFSRATS